MKKVYLILGVAALTFGSCTNKGAYTEEEKKTQDSSDEVRHEDEFDKMQAELDSTNKKAGEAGKQGAQKQIKPEELPGNQVTPYVPPTPPAAQDPGKLPPPPPMQTPKK